MPIGGDSFYRLVKQQLATYWTCTSDAMAKYNEDPNRMTYRTTTTAQVRLDLIFDRLIAAFADSSDTGVVEDTARNLRFWRLSEDVLLWFKKVDLAHRTQNYPTQHNQLMLSGQQAVMFPMHSIIVVGYLTDVDDVQIRRLSFAPPAPDQPPWYFDIVRSADIKTMPGKMDVVSGNRQLRVIRSPKQSEFGT